MTAQEGLSLSLSFLAALNLLGLMATQDVRQAVLCYCDLGCAPGLSLLGRDDVIPACDSKELTI